MKAEVIKKVIDETMTKEDARQYLQITRRQIDRLIIKYKNEGDSAFIHKNRGRKSEKATAEDIKNKIIELYLIEYYDYNFTHFYEEINNKFNLSLQTVFSILEEEGIISPLANRATKNKYNKEMQEAINEEHITEEKKVYFKERLLTEEKAHTRKSNLYYQFGEQLQIDASEFVWFGDVVTQLHLIVDKATKIVLFGAFDYQETTQTYFILLMNVVLIYGIPETIRSDKRKCFDPNKYGELTQFGRACMELGIKLDCSSNPRFKPNVERENHTFKNRLKAELRHENITTIEKANEYLNEIFIPKMNNKFAYKIDSKKTRMKKNKFTYDELCLIMSEKYSRLIDTGSCVKFNNKFYIPIDESNQKICYKNKTPCVVIITYRNDLWCCIEQKYYKLKEIENKEYSPAQAANEIKDEMKKPKKQYIPPSTHPWRRSY